MSDLVACFLFFFSTRSAARSNVNVNVRVWGGGGSGATELGNLANCRLLSTDSWFFLFSALRLPAGCSCLCCSAEKTKKHQRPFLERKQQDFPWLLRFWNECIVMQNRTRRMHPSRAGRPMRATCDGRHHASHASSSRAGRQNPAPSDDSPARQPPDITLTAHVTRNAFFSPCLAIAGGGEESISGFEHKGLSVTTARPADPCLGTWNK